MPHVDSLSLSTSLASPSDSAAGDVASAICGCLIVNGGYTCGRLAQSLGLPPLVIAESIRSGESSASMRSLLSHWIQENSSANAVVPASLIKTLSDACALDEVDAQRETTKYLQEPAVMQALDPVTRQHFESLERSVGQSFISILNDPGDLVESADWGSWLGGKLYEAFDYNGHSGNRVEEALQQAIRTYNSAPESASALCVESPPRTDFTDYTSLVASAYATNREESRQVSRGLRNDQSQAPEAELPWPTAVPEEFFDKLYESNTVIHELEVNSTPSHSSIIDPKAEEAPTAEKAIRADTFAKDIEHLEHRNKELREWEGAVEACLLKHAQSRSEDFSVSSQQFQLLTEKAQEALSRAREVRAGDMTRGTTAVHNYFYIGSLYRRRNNYQNLYQAVYKAQKVMRKIVDIENWSALPERDISELASYVQHLLDLESFLQTDCGDHNINSSGVIDDESTHVDWSKLRCLEGVPKRTASARVQLENLIHMEAIACLTGDLQLPDLQSRAVSAFEGAALMGIMDSVLRTYYSEVVHMLWASTHQHVIEDLMSIGSLDDATANSLLSVTFSYIPTMEERRSLFKFCAQRPFRIYMQMFAKIVEQVIDKVRSIAHNWGCFLVECLPKALALYDNVSDIIRQSTVALFTTVCEQTEMMVALMVETRDGAVATNVIEVNRIVRASYGFIPLVLDPVERLASLMPEELEGIAQRFSSIGKAIRVSTFRFSKRYLKAQHTTQLEKLKMVMQSESWTPREDIDAAFQAHLEVLCASDAEAVATFREASVESTRPGANAGSYYALMMDSRAQSVTKRGEPLQSSTTTDDGLGLTSNKLYISLDGDGEGRVVSSSFLILVELLYEYDSFLAQFPSLGVEVVSRMYELAALYDTLCAELVLGAKAMENGTVQNITTQHLCVASQCVAMLSETVAKLQQRLLRALNVERTDSHASKLLPFIEKDLGRVIADCRKHRNEFFHKMGSLVLIKVESLCSMEPNGQWSTQGNEWVMAMLREAARLMRAVRPLLPASDVQGVVAPLVGTLALKIREVTRTIRAPDARAMATSDVLLFKVNVERFGFDTLGSAAVTSVSDAMKPGVQLGPRSSDEEVLRWFFPGE